MLDKDFPSISEFLKEKIPALDSLLEDSAIDKVTQDWLEEFLDSSEETEKIINLYINTYRRNP